LSPSARSHDVSVEPVWGIIAKRLSITRTTARRLLEQTAEAGRSFWPRRVSEAGANKSDAPIGAVSFQFRSFHRSDWKQR
jgi:hypothetical protein